MSLIALIILIVGGFMAFKYIGVNLEKKQIKKEVFDMLGSTRGGDKSEADLVALIEDILMKHNVEIMDVKAELRSSIIYYSFSYRMKTDFLLFQRTEDVAVADEIENYG